MKKTNFKIMEESKAIILSDAREYAGLLEARKTQQFQRLIEQQENGLELSKYDLEELEELLQQNYHANTNLNEEEIEKLNCDELEELEAFEILALRAQKNEIVDFIKNGK